MRISRCHLASSMLLALALAGLAAAAAPQTYTLRLHQGEGDVAAYTFNATATGKLTGAEVPWKSVTANAQLESVAEFLGPSPDGNILVQGQVTGGTVKGQVDGKPRMAPVEGSMVNYILTPRADVKELNVMAGTPAQTAIIGVAFSADDAFLPPPLPAGPVRIGDRWPSVAHIPVLLGEPGESKEMKYDSKVLGQVPYAGRNCLKIKSTARQFEQATMEAPDGSGKATFKLGGTGSVIWLFDPKAGLVMKSDSDLTMTIAMVFETISEGEQTWNGSVRVSAHSRMTKYNGEKVPAK